MKKLPKYENDSKYYIMIEKDQEFDVAYNKS